MPPHAGLPRVGACASPCRPSPAPTWPTCRPVSRMRGLRRRAVSPRITAGAEGVRAIVAKAQEMSARDTWPDPDLGLIDDDRPPAPALDDDALPAGWESWITAEAAA